MNRGFPLLASCGVLLAACSAGSEVKEHEHGASDAEVPDSPGPTPQPPRDQAQSEIPLDPEARAPLRRKLMAPRRNGVCRFEERDPGERPSGLIQTNRLANMIFWADPGAALWDHSNGEVDEGMVIPGKRIVAQRQGMKDLWISPGRDGDIMLYSGLSIFECRMREESAESP